MVTLRHSVFCGFVVTLRHSVFLLVFVCCRWCLLYNLHPTLRWYWTTLTGRETMGERTRERRSSPASAHTQVDDAAWRCCPLSCLPPHKLWVFLRRYLLTFIHFSQYGTCHLSWQFKVCFLIFPFLEEHEEVWTYFSRRGNCQRSHQVAAKGRKQNPESSTSTTTRTTTTRTTRTRTTRTRTTRTAEFEWSRTPSCECHSGGLDGIGIKNKSERIKQIK